MCGLRTATGRRALPLCSQAMCSQAMCSQAMCSQAMCSQAMCIQAGATQRGCNPPSVSDSRSRLLDRLDGRHFRPRLVSLRPLPFDSRSPSPKSVHPDTQSLPGANSGLSWSTNPRTIGFAYQVADAQCSPPQNLAPWFGMRSLHAGSFHFQDRIFWEACNRSSCNPVRDEPGQVRFSRVRRASHPHRVEPEPGRNGSGAHSTVQTRWKSLNKLNRLGETRRICVGTFGVHEWRAWRSLASARLTMQSADCCPRVWGDRVVGSLSLRCAAKQQFSEFIDALPGHSPS
jgi:hypothetical protein